MKLFDTEWQWSGTPKRHGMPWMKEETTVILTDFDGGFNLREICHSVQRPVSSVLRELVNNKRIKYDPQTEKYYMNELDNRPIAKQAGSIQTSAPFETKTFVYGEDAAKLTDGQLYEYIEKMEAKLNRMKAIVNKPGR